jgi:carboxyl-terminal processing protease
VRTIGATRGTAKQETDVSEQDNIAGAPQVPQWNSPAPNQRASAPQGGAQIIATAVLVAVAFAAGWFGNVYVNRNNQVPANDPNAQALMQAYRTISDQYVDTSAINQRQMAYAAINAMVNSLGDTGHSRFETPAEIQQENNSLQNAPTVGIGVLLSGGGQQPLQIDEVFPKAPADGKLKPGDIILAVNGKNISGMTLDQVRPLITGAQGTNVTLTIQRPGVAKPLTVTITRGQFTVPLVSTYVIPGVNIADIQLTEFGASTSNSNDSTDAELRAALQQPDVKSAKGIILDLRDNPGGLLDQAVSVSSEFIPTGTGHSVYIDRTRSSQDSVTVQSGHQLATNIPMVILVNGNTASAAEITTAAIEYNADTLHDRPTVHVVGEHTFGTDTILTPIPLADGGQLLLGTSGWLTPSGKNVRSTGIIPDQVVTLSDPANEISPLEANEQHLTAQQILSGQDTQLRKAIQDLTPQSGS